MGRSVIVRYVPLSGREDDLLAAVRDHLAVLRAEGLVTARPPHVMRAADGSILEVFEWISPEAISQAHDSPAVAALWERFEACCSYETLTELAEAGELFSEFETIDL